MHAHSLAAREVSVVCDWRRNETSAFVVRFFRKAKRQRFVDPCHFAFQSWKLATFTSKRRYILAWMTRRRDSMRNGLSPPEGRWIDWTLTSLPPRSEVEEIANVRSVWATKLPWGIKLNYLIKGRDGVDNFFKELSGIPVASAYMEIFPRRQTRNV